jgi:hypothetical protein
MILTTFSLEVSYSQLVISDSSIENPFNDWSDSNPPRRFRAYGDGELLLTPSLREVPVGWLSGEDQTECGADQGGRLICLLRQAHWE